MSPRLGAFVIGFAIIAVIAVKGGSNPAVALASPSQPHHWPAPTIPQYFSFTFEMTTNLSSVGAIHAQGRGIAAADLANEVSLRLVYAYKPPKEDGFTQESITGFGPLYVRRLYAAGSSDAPRPIAFLFPTQQCVATTLRHAKTPAAAGPLIASQATFELPCAVPAPKTIDEEITLRVFFSAATGVIVGFAFEANLFVFRTVAAQQYSFPDTTFSREQIFTEEAPCEFWMQGGQECFLTPARTSPTQLDVGRAEVNEKFNAFVKLTPTLLKQRLARRMLPVIVGPPKPGSSQRARFFLIDGHHQMASLNEASPGTPAPVYILCNWRHMNEADFFARMEERHWTFLMTPDGKHLTYESLPATFEELGNSGYRALARLMIGRAVQKSCVPFAEFYWGSYLQNEGLEINPAHMGSLEDLSANYLDAAMWLARKPDASFLPGYMPLGQRVPFIHPECQKKVCDLMDDVELNLIPMPVTKCSLPGGICAKLEQRYVAREGVPERALQSSAQRFVRAASSPGPVLSAVLVVLVVAILVRRKRNADPIQ